MISDEPFPIPQLPLVLSIKRFERPTCLPGNAKAQLTVFYKLGSVCYTDY